MLSQAPVYQVMAPQKPVVNELKPGNSWLVFWELRGIPVRTFDDTLTANATFTCGKKVYKVVFNLLENDLSKWNLQLNFENKKGNGNLNDQVSYFL